MSQERVRVGDRYVHDHLRITVSAVVDDSALINVLDTESGSKWTKRQPMPFPGGFIRVYSAPPEWCEECDRVKPAPGMAYCDDCMDLLAGRPIRS